MTNPALLPARGLQFDKAVPPPGIEALEDSAPSLFAQLRSSRGWSAEFLTDIDNPAYDELLDMPAMVTALHRVATTDEQLVILPDFDMDGITAGVLGWAGLNELGIDAELYVPDYRRGHEITVDAVEELRALFPDATTVLTCDGGVNSHEGLQRAVDLGLRVLVTDHHLQLDHGSPAEVVINPMRTDETYAHPKICGAFVLHQVLLAYARAHRPDRLDSITLLALFAGVGTVSDVMPLLYENRQLVRNSLSLTRLLYVHVPIEDTVTVYDIERALLLQLLRADSAHAPEFLTAFQGFAVCLKAFREQGKLRSIADLDEGFYGFYLAPTFNSIRRVDGDMADAFGAFTQPDAAHQLACVQRVIDGNERRKTMIIDCMTALENSDQPLAPWVYTTDAPSGMLGLMASQLMEASGMPVVVLRTQTSFDQPWNGSARSPFWFPVITTMTAAGFSALGHENACGIRIPDRASLEAFAAHLATTAAELHARLVNDGTLAAVTAADLVLGSGPECDGPIDDVPALLSLASAIQQVAPFGHGFRQPEFDLVIDLSNTTLGVIGSDQTHLRMVLRSGLKLLWWNSAHLLPELQELATSPVPRASVVTLRASLTISAFNGEEYVQATVRSDTALGADEDTSVTSP